MIYIVIAQLALIAGLEYLHIKERKQLLNRILAKDPVEFKMLEQPAKAKKKEEPKPPVEFI